MASNDDRDLVEFTIKSNVVSSEAIRRFKRSMRIDEMKVSRFDRPLAFRFRFHSNVFQF